MNLFHSEAGFFIFDKEENFYDLAVFLISNGKTVFKLT